MPTFSASASSFIKQRFYYDQLDTTTSQFVQQQTREIKVLMKRTAEDIVEIGCKLIEVKSRLKHGQFSDWLTAEFSWTDRMARQFMRVASVFKSENFSDLTFDLSALYQLAAPSTPQAARDEAISRATAGEPITYSIAKAIKQKYSSTPRARRKQIVEKLPLLPTTKLQPEKQEPRAENRPRQEILAIRPKEVVQEPISTQEIEATLRTTSSAKSSFIKPNTWWQVAEQHLFYCGSPNSSRFQERLPNQVALQLTFPPERTSWQESVSPKIKSALCLWSSYSDQDLQLLLKLVEQSVLLYTESNETVVFSFLPDPNLLLLAQGLGCRCLIAEPDLGRCQTAIAVWQAQGWRIEQIKSLRF